MNFQEVNEILKAKYPEGSASKLTDGKIMVTFDSDGKAYEYRCKNYNELLKKLNIPTTYKKDIPSIQSRINDLENELKKGGCEDPFTEEFIAFTDRERDNIINELNHQKEKLTFVLI